MSLHEGHRQRMRERFRSSGLDGMQDHEVLEMLLFYCISRKNTNEIAHKLLKEFKSITGVLNATPTELMQVEGVGENVATYLSFIRQMERYYISDKINSDEILWNMDKCYQYMKSRFVSKRNETAMLLCLDAKCKLLGCHVVGEGGLNSTNVSIRKIIEIAMNTNASSVMLAHNHPGGLAVPSAEDVAVTKEVAKALKMIDVVLTDHIIIADNEYISLRESQLYQLEI